MKHIAEHLENALTFERLAENEPDAILKESLLEQAAAYRRLAMERAEKYGLSPPSAS